jgi:acyl-CoA reductase-like NAD-dependent aldehyde dehydrogenase
MVAQLGLANVPDIVEEASQPSSTAGTAQPAPQPPPQPQPQSDATQDASAQTEDAAAAQRAAEEEQRTVDLISGEERARIAREAKEQSKRENQRLTGFSKTDQQMIVANPVNTAAEAYRKLGFKVNVIDARNNPTIVSPSGKMSTYRAV